MNPRLVLPAGLAVLIACTPDEPPAELSADPVVVYASYADTSYLPTLFSAHTKETGTIVIVRHGEAGAIVDDVIRNDIDPPADLLLTRSVRGIERAANEGALLPAMRHTAAAGIAPQLRDPDGFWAALSFRGAVIVGAAAGGPEALGEPASRGRVCLTSSSRPENLGVISMLIAERGIRDAELLVRGWVANLARQPLESEAELIAALENGDCGLGIVSSRAAIPDGIRQSAVSGYADIEGLGVARHARNPEGAVALVNWLLSDNVQQRHASHTGSFRASDLFAGNRNVAVIARHHEEAMKLAERASYR